MSRFEPHPDDTIVIGGETYTFLEHPAIRRGGLRMVHAAEGRKGVVYRLRDSRGRFKALKVFKEEHRLREIWTVNTSLNIFDSIPGITVCQRETIAGPKHKPLLNQYPDLQYAVLMPWVEGDNWENFWGRPDKHQLTGVQALQLAQGLAFTLAQIEYVEAAHCDLAGSNIMVDEKSLCVELIDIEDSFIPGLQPPSSKPAGTSGYQHRTSRSEGQWQSEGDRFACGILLSEIITWHIHEIQEAAGDEPQSYFQDADLEFPSATNPKYKLMLELLSSSSSNLADLFTATWRAPQLEDCPSIAAWYAAIKTAKPVSDNGPRLLGTPYFIDIKYHDSNQTVPLLSWCAIEGAESYEIQIADDIGFTQNVQPVYRGRDIQTYCMPVEYPRFIHIRAVARSGTRTSGWSTPVQIGKLQTAKVESRFLPDENVTEFAWATLPIVTRYEALCARMEATTLLQSLE